MHLAGSIAALPQSGAAPGPLCRAGPPRPLPARARGTGACAAPPAHTSFWGGELLNFTARPISSPVGYNHLKLVVAVRKQPGHYAPVSVSRKTHILPFFGDPQVLQQTTVSPEIGLQETCMASEAFPI